MGENSMNEDSKGFEVPVVFMVFSRPDTTRVVFERIAQIKPKHLLVIADGARAGRDGEAARCEEVRRIATAVTWDCELLTNFADTNMGCRRRVVSGLEWAFQQVERAVIVEDDVLPDLSFFRFCEEMLDRYQDDIRVSTISGFNVAADALALPYSYCFSEMAPLWGWATWRRSWKLYDEHMSSWPEVLQSGSLADFFTDESVLRYWVTTLQKTYDDTGTWNTWDYQWIYMNLTTRSLSVVPARNLIENVGYGDAGTHTKNGQLAPSVSLRSMEFPLRHPPVMIASRSRDAADLRIRGWFRPRAPKRAARKLVRILKSRFGLYSRRDGTTTTR